MKLFGSLTGGRGAPAKSSLPWIALNDINMLDELKEASFDQPVLIYKHSTRCGISSMMLGRLEREYDLEDGRMHCYFLDLIRFREISAEIARSFGVMHESPQIILIKNGKVAHHASHNAISFKPLKNHLH